MYKYCLQINLKKCAYRDGLILKAWLKELVKKLFTFVWTIYYSLSVKKDVLIYVWINPYEILQKLQKFL